MKFLFGILYGLRLEIKIKKNLSAKEVAIDFNVGYILMIITALVFLSLGGLVLHHSGAEMSSKAHLFTSQFINVYSSTIGDWSKNIIAIAILAAIFSTTLAVIDIYPRSVAIGSVIAKGQYENNHAHRNVRLFVTILFCAISYLIIYFL